MAVSQELSRFVREALTQGRSREEIAQALTTSGWSDTEISDALHAWADTPFVPPVPRPQVTVSARDFFIYALTFGLMFVGAIYLVQLLHALIDVAARDEGYGSYSQIRRAIAALVVTTPVFLWLTLRERRRLTENPAIYRSAIRKWMIYLTLLLSSAVLIGDLIAAIYAFLSGEVTGQFLAKAAVVAAIAGMIFAFHAIEARRDDRP